MLSRESVPNRKTQQGRLLQLLVDVHGGEVPAPEFARVSLQYSTRVLELWRLGFTIINRVETVNGVKHGFFRLETGPAAVTSMPAPVPAPTTTPQNTLFGDTSAVGRYPD